MDPEASPRDGHVHPTFFGKVVFEAVVNTLSFLARVEVEILGTQVCRNVNLMPPRRVEYWYALMSVYRCLVTILV